MYFKLKLKSELVFDGDAGVTAPSGSTTRTGIEWGNQISHQFMAVRETQRSLHARAVRP